MAVQILAQMAVPMILEALKTGLEKVDHPAAIGARAAIDQLENAVGSGSITPDQMAAMNAHIEKMADIDSARDQVSIAQVNESLRAEISSTDPYVRRMRPTFGYMMAVTWGAQMFAVAYVIVANPARAGEVMNAMEGLSTIWAVALSVMGIYMYQRSAEKKAGVDVPSLSSQSLVTAPARAPTYNN